MTMDYCKYYASLAPEAWRQAVEFSSSLDGELPELAQIEIHPISPGVCFNRCIYCAGGQTLPPDEAEILTAEKMIAASNDAISLGAKQVVVASNSGDPALNPHLDVFLRHLQENTSVRWGLHTCGRDLHRLPSLTLKPDGRGYISIGLDAVLEPAYQATKQPRTAFPGHQDACRQVTSNIKKLCQMKLQMNSGLFISLSCQLTRKNFGAATIEELLRFALWTPGINRIRFSVPFPPTNCSPQQRQAFLQRVCPEENEVQEINKTIRQFVRRLRESSPNPSAEILPPIYFHYVSGSTRPRDYSYCANQLLFVVLGPDSWLYPCTTVTATRLQRRLVRFSREGDLCKYWYSDARQSRLWFDIRHECAGFECSRCEHAVNARFDLRPPVMDPSKMTSLRSVEAPCTGNRNQIPTKFKNDTVESKR